MRDGRPMTMSDHMILGNRRRRMAMSVAEAAIEANIGRDGIYEAIREGRLEARKWGRRTLITDEALQRFLNALPPLCRQQRSSPIPTQSGGGDDKLKRPQH
jgi:excisionase family DNA binding protein